MGKQGKGRRLTDKERLEIIALTRQNPRIKHVELATKYNVNESTIRKWRAQSNATKIEERYAHGVLASRDGRQRGQAVRNEQFDAELYEWVVDMTKQGVNLAPARVREKARALAAQYDGMEGFKASSGWFYRFCRRYGLPCGPTGRSEPGSKLHDDITIAAMMPDDVSAHSEAEAALAQHVSAVAAAQASLVSTEGAHTHPEEDDMSATDPAAIAMSLQPPPALPVSAPPAQEASMEASVEVAAPSPSEVAVQESEVELKTTAEATSVGTPPSAARDLLLGLGEITAVSSTASVSAELVVPTSTTTIAPVAVATPSTSINVSATGMVPAALPLGQQQAFSMAQAAATHMVQHFKDVLDPQTRLRLVRHFTRVAGEAEMYLVMDDETRLEYVKEFVAASSTATPSPPPAALGSSGGAESTS